MDNVVWIWILAILFFWSFSLRVSYKRSQKMKDQVISRQGENIVELQHVVNIIGTMISSGTRVTLQHDSIEQRYLEARSNPEKSELHPKGYAQSIGSRELVSNIHGEWSFQFIDFKTGRIFDDFSLDLGPGEYAYIATSIERATTWQMPIYFEQVCRAVLRPSGVVYWVWRLDKSNLPEVKMSV